MKKTIQQLREDRGESQTQLADALGATLADITDLEIGVAGPSVTRLRLLTEHFGVREEDIDLEPHRPPSIGEHWLIRSTSSGPEPDTQGHVEILSGMKPKALRQSVCLTRQRSTTFEDSATARSPIACAARPAAATPRPRYPPAPYRPPRSGSTPLE